MRHEIGSGVLAFLLCCPTLVSAQANWPDYMSSLDAGISTGPIHVAVPNDVKVEPPAADVLPAKAKWSGKWSGWACRKQDCDTKLVVEKVTNEGATIIYLFASPKISPYNARLEAKFEGDELQATLRSGANIGYRMRKDGNIEFLWWRGDARTAGILSKDR